MSTPDRRTRIAEGAADLIAEHGIRALTHRALDTALDLPAGSTSYYFRTRRALIDAVVEAITTRSRTDFEAAQFTAPAAPVAPRRADVANGIAIWIDELLRDRRNQLIARHALIIEYASDQQLREQLSASIFSRDRAVELFGALSSGDPVGDTDDFLALLEGLVFDRLVGARATLPAGNRNSVEQLRGAIERFIAGGDGSTCR